MNARCPHCGGAIQLIVPPAEPPPRELDMLDTGQLAERFHRTRGQVARLCRDGKEFGIAGIEKVGKDWRATVEAIREVQARKGRR